jgi:hypothetical protein
MHDSEGEFPDDVPTADALEQQRPTADPVSADEESASQDSADEVPLEASAPDWQEQRQTVLDDPELEER